MNRESPDSSPSSRNVYIAAGCLLACFIGLFLPSTPSAPAVGAQPRAKTTPSRTVVTSSAASAGERRVTFARTMPRTNGAQVFDNTGKPNLAMVMVAIPDGAKSVRFLRGTDPAALRYLAETELQQKRTHFDRGPQDIDTSEIADLGPLRGRTTRHVRNLAADDTPKAPPPGPQ